jgi:hypothetical protein
MGGAEPEKDRNSLNDNITAIKGEVIWPPLFYCFLEKTVLAFLLFLSVDERGWMKTKVAIVGATGYTGV